MAAPLPLPPPPDLVVEPIVRAALLEDLGRAGDITTDAIIPPDLMARGVIAARTGGSISGVRAAALAFQLVEPSITVTVHAGEGARVGPGDTVIALTGPAASLLTAERTALNLICHLSGIATATQRLVTAVDGTKCRITCTRKTTPNLRVLEKAAVRAGGGANHRFGLDDAILIKDNHVALAGGVGEAIRRARARIGHLVKIEVEVDRLDQLDEALAETPDAILLDNMDPQTIARAVETIAGRATVEASGRITAETARAIAEAGVDLISAGWLTHSAASLDLGLDIET